MTALMVAMAREHLETIDQCIDLLREKGEGNAALILEEFSREELERETKLIELNKKALE